MFNDINGRIQDFNKEIRNLNEEYQRIQFKNNEKYDNAIKEIERKYNLLLETSSNFQKEGEP